MRTTRRLGMALALAGTMLPPAWVAPVGDLKVPIKEYDVPTPHSGPHDPAVAPDGSLWYSGQMANKLGRLDPKTGEIKEYPLKTEGSGPHGLVADSQGNIWFTVQNGNFVGRLDPRTGEIRLKEVRTPRAVPYGIVWYSESGVMPNTLVRFNPTSQAFARENIPSGGGVVRNMVATPAGDLYLACSSVNKVAVVVTR